MVHYQTAKSNCSNHSLYVLDKAYDIVYICIIQYLYHFESFDPELHPEC